MRKYSKSFASAIQLKLNDIAVLQIRAKMFFALLFCKKRLSQHNTYLHHEVVTLLRSKFFCDK